jgi:asparagine synthetase B (glutamine-hydrolysing)
MDWHGIERRYVRDDGATAASLLSLVPPLRFDPDGVRAAWGERDDPGATVVAGVRRLVADPKLAPSWAHLCGVDAWRADFEAAVAEIARSASAPIVALGGGIDAATVLVAWRASGVAMPAVATLETGLADYDEVDAALAIARALDVRCDVVRVSPAEIVELVDEAVTVAETPLYNLHPVHRLAFARALGRMGYATLVTGDGADAVFAGRPDHDYVPIVAALTHAAGLRLASPFFDSRMVTARRAREPKKRMLRDYLTRAGFRAIARRPKRPRWMPALPLEPLVDRRRLDELARAIDVPVQLDTDRERVGWITFERLAQRLEARA